MTRRMTVLAMLLVLALCFGLTGCARSPGGASSTAGPQLIITMTVAGSLNPQYSYFVLFNSANDATGANGPIPVIASPWGNGFAAGRTADAGLTHFVRIDAAQRGDGTSNISFGVYSVVPGSGLRTFQYLGTPIQQSLSSNTLQFQIPLSQLATTTIPAADIRYLQINFLATNIIPTDPNYAGTKYFDALGESTQQGEINDYITIPTTRSAIYQNSDKGLEPSGDVAEAGNGVYRPVNEPDLDITDWRVEVRD